MFFTRIGLNLWGNFVIFDRMKDVRITDKWALFWSGWLSNWYPCSLQMDGKTFISSEQAYMYEKAVYFGDGATAQKILRTDNPKDAKRFGRAVVGFDQGKWDEVKYEIMKRCVHEKFSQNPGLRRMLLSPELDDKKFAEGSPFDTIWGIGIDWRDPLSSNEKNWKGQNLLGQIITEVRNSFKQEEFQWD